MTPETPPYELSRVMQDIATTAVSVDPTCGNCGKPMRYNVPRIGPDGGYVHAETGKLECSPARKWPDGVIDDDVMKSSVVADILGLRECDLTGSQWHRLATLLALHRIAGERAGLEQAQTLLKR